MTEDDTIRVRHMLEAARVALAFAQGRTRRDLDTDRMFTLALMKSIEIIGEAATKVSRPVQAQHPDIPWADIVAMRNRLIHVYFSINHDVLWQTVSGDLPRLVQQLERAVAEERGNGK